MFDSARRSIVARSFLQFLKMKSLRAGFALLFVCLSLPVFAGPADEALQRFADGTKTLSAHFEQIQVDEHNEVISRRSGQFDLARPGHLRWHYDKPYAQLMVCDGDRIWNYEPDLAQVTVRPADVVLKGTPASLLAQQRQLGDAFIVESGGKQEGAAVVRLKPKNQTEDRQSDGEGKRVSVRVDLGGRRII